MIIKICKKGNLLRLVAVVGLVTALLLPGRAGVPLAHAETPVPEELPTVPVKIPSAATDGFIYLPTATGPRATTIVPELQEHLTKYLEDYHLPIAAVVVADVKTGAILAMAQGRAPQKWGGKVHTALHAAFPAASLFKTVVTTAAFEVADIDSHANVGLFGGCAHVKASGVFMTERRFGRQNQMSLRRAFGHSCNGFFAKIAVNNLGLGVITNFAKRYGWDTGVPTDFHLDHSPFIPPAPENSSADTVGRFAAGFGYVGLSAVHAAWIMLTIANDGATIPIKLFRDTANPSSEDFSQRIYSAKTAERLHHILDASVHGGTAAFAFRHGKYRKLRDLVGGKTGTLTGHSPQGVTTWFAGMSPVENPEVVVAAVVMLEDRWFIKGPQLAAEALWAYYDEKINQQTMMISKSEPIATKEPPKESR